ncbi:MAG: hypothetical protein AB8B91_04300 [Rubripirellula sp.]
MLLRYADACNRLGWIGIASNDSKNGPLQDRAIESMWKQCQERFSIDSDRVYISGFSGGARVATWFAANHATRGHLAIGAVMGYDELPKTTYYLLSGNEDPATKELQRAETLLRERGSAVHRTTFSGKHVMAREKDVATGLRWLAEQTK